MSKIQVAGTEDENCEENCCYLKGRGKRKRRIPGFLFSNVSHCNEELASEEESSL